MRTTRAAGRTLWRSPSRWSRSSRQRFPQLHGTGRARFRAHDPRSRETIRRRRSRRRARSLELARRAKDPRCCIPRSARSRWSGHGARLERPFRRPTSCSRLSRARMLGTAVAARSRLCARPARPRRRPGAGIEPGHARPSMARRRPGIRGRGCRRRRRGVSRDGRRGRTRPRCDCSRESTSEVRARSTSTARSARLGTCARAKQCWRRQHERCARSARS